MSILKLTKWKDLCTGYPQAVLFRCQEPLVFMDQLQVKPQLMWMLVMSGTILTVNFTLNYTLWDKLRWWVSNSTFTTFLMITMGFNGDHQNQCKGIPTILICSCSMQVDQVFKWFLKQFQLTMSRINMKSILKIEWNITKLLFKD